MLDMTASFLPRDFVCTAMRCSAAWTAAASGSGSGSGSASSPGGCWDCRFGHRLCLRGTE